MANYRATCGAFRIVPWGWFRDGVTLLTAVMDVTYSVIVLLHTLPKVTSSQQILPKCQGHKSGILKASTSE